MAKKRDLLDFQPVVKSLTIGEALYHIPWLDKNEDHIRFIQVIILFPTNIIFNEISSSVYREVILNMIFPRLKFFKCLVFPVG